MDSAQNKIKNYSQEYADFKDRRVFNPVLNFRLNVVLRSLMPGLVGLHRSFSLTRALHPVAIIKASEFIFYRSDG